MELSARNHRKGRIGANDGYQVVLSGGELDPNFGDAPTLLAWEQDGEPLSCENGPPRLVVPGICAAGATSTAS